MNPLYLTIGLKLELGVEEVDVDEVLGLAPEFEVLVVLVDEEEVDVALELDPKVKFKLEV